MELGNMLFGNSRGRFQVERHPLQDIFVNFLLSYGFDGYGFLDPDNPLYTPQKEDYATFENDTFLVRPYYWGDDDEIMGLPNFVFKPENIEIQWYKYPLRDAYSNTPLDEDKMREIISICQKDLDKNMKKG